MECNIIELKSLVEDQRITDLENQIAEKQGFSIYKGNYDRLLELLKKDIDNSMLEFNDIARFISEKPDVIERFTIHFLERENIKSISFGFSLMYAIYLIYIIEKSETELYSYIVKKRIPKPQRVVKQIMYIKKQMGL